MIQNLLENEYIMTDGTFKVVPHPFIQLKTFNFFVYIDADINNRQRIRKLLSPLYILGTHKDQNIYEMMMQQLQVWANNHHIIIRWQRIMMDNEVAMINAVRNLVPNINISLCYFHVCQAIQRWLTEHGLILAYKERGDFYIFVRILRALAFLPINQVMDTYNNGLNDLYELALQYLIYFFNPNDNEDEIDLAIARMNAFMQYMEINYINDAKIPLWNVYNLDDHRTNNDLEGNSRLPKRPNTNIWYFVNGIRNEQRTEDLMVAQLNRGLRFPLRRRLNREREETIRQSKIDLANNVITVRDYLHRMSVLYN